MKHIAITALVLVLSGCNHNPHYQGNAYNRMFYSGMGILANNAPGSSFSQAVGRGVLMTAPPYYGHAPQFPAPHNPYHYQIEKQENGGGTFTYRQGGVPIGTGMKYKGHEVFTPYHPALIEGWRRSMGR